jgi:hypothetical protein
MRKVVWELYEARLNRTLWQIVYEFDRERAEAALEHLRQRYGVSEDRLWERRDELYLTWLAFRLADELEAYLKSGAGRGFRAKEEFGDLLALGRWLPVDLAPLFWLRLVGDAEGEAEFRAAWVTAVNMWLERMAAPYSPKKPAVARKAVELFNAFVGAAFKYEELFPPPQPKPAEAARPETAAKPEAVKPVEAKRAAVKPDVKPAKAAKPEKPVEAKPVERPAVEVQRPEERGLRRDVEKVTAKPEAVKPTEVKKPEAVKPAEPAAEAAERGLRREEKPKAPIADVIPERAEAVDYLLRRFGDVLDREAAFKAKDFVVAKVKARLEKMAAKEPEFVHLLAEVAEHVLSSFGRLMASPNAARHAHDVLFRYFEGYETRDGEVLFARIERTVREAVRKAEEAGIPDAEYRIKQFILWLIKQLEEAGERYRRDALKGIYTVEKTLRATAFAGLSAAALYSVYSGLYSEAVVSSVASAVALAEVGRFREAVEYVQRAAKALYEAAKDVFEHVKITVQRLVELFIEAVARALACIDEHKAYLFLMAAVAARAVALSAALSIWGLIELDKLAYAASLTPFVPAGVQEYSREEVFNMLKNASDPYERFKEIAEDANAGRVKLAEPWESLRVLIMPKPSEEEMLMHGGGARLYSKYREDENYKRALFYAAWALEETLGVYRSALEEYTKRLREAVRREVVGEEPFKKVIYVADLEQIKQEEEAFENALRTLRERLNEYSVMNELRGLLDVDEDVARRLAEAKQLELSNFSGVNFGVKAYAALIAYREYALDRRGAFGVAAWYWLEEGGSARLLYYAPITAYKEAEKAEVVRPAAVEELVAEALRRLFLKPGADHLHRFVEELTKGGRLALMLEDKTESSYVFKLYKLEGGDKLVELEGVKLKIRKVGEGIVYSLEFDDIERWQEFFKPELEAAVKAAEVVGGRLPVEDFFPYMLGWVDSDVAIIIRRNERVLQMGTSHLWQLAETRASFGWSRVVELRINLTLEGPKLAVTVEAPLEELDDAIEKSAEGGWLYMLGTKAGLKDLMRVKSWEDLKWWVAKNWDIVVDAAARRLGEEVRGELNALRDKLKKDKVAREVVAPALLLIQAERLGVNETTLRYFGAVISGAIGGDGYVSAAMKKVELASGKHAVALLWKAALVAHGIETEVRDVGEGFVAVTSGGDAARLAGLYFLYGPPLLEGDERIINHKLAEAVELAAMGLDIRWEGLRRTGKGRVAADLTISVGGATVKYNVYLLKDAIKLEFRSTDWSRVELAVRMLRVAGVTAEVRKEGGRDAWYVRATTDMLAAGREELRKALAEIVREAEKEGHVNKNTAERWLEKLERGLVLMEGWPKYEVGLDKGAPMVRFTSTNPDNIEQEAQWLRNMGLKEDVHFSVKMPDGGKAGYVRIHKAGLMYLARLSVRSKDKQQREQAAVFVNYILRKAENKGEGVYEKVKKIIAEGRARGSLKLERFEKWVEVNGKTYFVKVTSGEAVEENQNGKLLLRIKITAEVGYVKDGQIEYRVEREYTITYSRQRADNAAKGVAYARADPDGREADAERLAAVIEALTGVKPMVYRRSDDKIMIVCGRKHLDGFMRYAELVDVIESWLEKTER